MDSLKSRADLAFDLLVGNITAEITKPDVKPAPQPVGFWNSPIFTPAHVLALSVIIGCLLSLADLLWS